MEKQLSRLPIFVFALSVSIFLWSLWKRPVHIDDVWLAEYSYWLEKLGYVKSEAMRGFFSAENKLYVYHKLLAIEGAFAIRWFGFSPYVLKSISLIFLIGGLYAAYSIFKKHGKQSSSPYLLFALFLSFFHTVNLGFTFRPEVHLMFWGLLSFICLEKFLDDPRKKKALFMAGILSGVGTATHLNGVVFTGATVAFLWIQRRWLAGFIFGAIASWGIFFYFLFDARSLEELKLSWLHLTHWRDVATGSYGGIAVFFRVFTEQGRYLHSPPEMFYTFMLLVLLVPTWKILWREQRRLVLYLIVLFVFVAQVTHGTNTNYLMYALPFFLILAVYAFDILKQQGKVAIAYSGIAVFLIGSWSYNIAEFSNREANIHEYEKVASFLPLDAKVLSPAYLMFPGLGKLQIQSFVGYRDKVESKQLSPTPEGLTAEAEKYDIRYIVFDESNLKFFGIEGSEYGRFKLLPEQPSENFKVFEYLPK